MADVAMPNAISSWMQGRDWGMHHLEWHLARIWDLLEPATRQWATGKGWARSAIQEGEAGNGMAFLAMHRVMIRQLLADFPQHAQLFDGWASPPLDPNDPIDPLPGNASTPFRPAMATAITRLHNNLTLFPSDDEFGLFVETSLRPIAGQPARRSSDASSGIHNYIHGRFEDPNSPIDMGDPIVNIENERFWRLHGWIDGRWTAFRTANGLSDQQAEYQAALTAAEAHMPSGQGPHHPPAGPVIFGIEKHAPQKPKVPSAIHANILRVLSERAKPPSS